MPHRFLRDSFVARLVYHLSGHKYFRHPDEKDDYIVPEKYYPGYFEKEKRVSVGSTSVVAGSDDFDRTKVQDDEPIESQEPQAQQEQEQEQEEKEGGGQAPRGVLDSQSSMLTTETKANFTNDGYIIVDWEGPDDPDNPCNWPWYEKSFLILEISLLTTSVYMASAVYTPGIEQMQQELGWSTVELSLGVFLFVLGYGIGPLLWSPLSENAIFGRTSIYIVTLFVFVVLQIPTALTQNVGGFCISRFLAGFFGSPCLATGGASVADVTHPWNIPISLAVWAIGAVAGPSMGPFFGSILTVKGGWRWCFWFIMIISGFALAVFSFLLPETYAPTLLARKAKRLRAKTGNPKITSAGILENELKSFKQILIETLWRPIEITVMEPVVLLIDIYIAMIYSILYLFFEAFPIYFVENRGFTLVELGLCYLSILVGVLVTVVFYIPLIRHLFTKPILNHQQIYPEVFIPLAIFGGCLLAAGLFIFAWSATTFTHWIGPLIGVAIIGGGAFLMFQTLFNYMSASFKTEYIASVYASNDLVRSSVASVFPIFGSALFNNLAIDNYPVGWGMCLIAFIATGMIAIPVLFYLNGPKLRARSKYAKSG